MSIAQKDFVGGTMLRQTFRVAILARGEKNLRTMRIASVPTRRHMRKSDMLQGCLNPNSVTTGGKLPLQNCVLAELRDFDIEIPRERLVVRQRLWENSCCVVKRRGRGPRRWSRKAKVKAQLIAG